MSASDWLLIGGLAWLVSYGMKVEAEEQRRAEREVANLASALAREGERRREEAEELERLEAVESERRSVPCFRDGVFSYEEFKDTALAAKKGSRLKQIAVAQNDATVVCTVASQSGQSTWDFILDFNDWGHVTGTCRLWAENKDSSIPTYFKEAMVKNIQAMLAEKGASFPSFGVVIAENKALGTEDDLRVKKNVGLLKRLARSMQKPLRIGYDADELQGEHVYVVESLLKRQGFCDIECKPIEDIDASNEERCYARQVASVSVGGCADFSSSDSFLECEPVVIAFHEARYIPLTFDRGLLHIAEYGDVVENLHRRGFSNIETRPQRDLLFGVLSKDKAVSRVLVENDDGEEEPVNFGTKYRYDVRLVVCFHSFKNERS